MAPRFTPLDYVFHISVHQREVEKDAFYTRPVIILISWLRGIYWYHFNLCFNILMQDLWVVYHQFPPDSNNWQKYSSSSLVVISLVPGDGSLVLTVSSDMATMGQDYSL